MGLTTYAGVADCHGIESFQEKSTLSSFEISCRVMRAAANRQRHAVYYEVDLDEEALGIINEYLDKDDYAMALEWMKRLGLIMSLPEHEDSWKLIPNVNLDPYS